MSGVEYIILMMFSIFADLINWIPGVNIIATIITYGVVLYFWFRGVPIGPSLVGNSLELIPGLSVAPLLSVAVGMTIYRDHNPESVISRITAVTAKIKTPKGGLAQSTK